MLVNWTNSRVKVIQVPSSKEMVVLAPGYNQIPDAQWKECRDLVLCQIADGVIVEEWLDVEKNGKQHNDSVFRGNATMPGDDPKQPNVVRIPATFKDITRKRTNQVIEETFNPKTLQVWYDDESRDDVRVKIFKQLEGINSGAITGEKKK